MTSLSSIQRFIQKPKTIFSLISISAVIIILLLLITIRYSAVIKKEQPDTIYGVLPYPEFIPKTLQHKTAGISVNLKQINLPEKNIGYVYKLMGNPDASLKVSEIASLLDFSKEPQNDSRFLSWSENGKSLTFDTKSSRLNFSSTLKHNSSRTISSIEEALTIAQNLLNEIGFIPDESQQKVTPLKAEGYNFISAVDPRVADAYEVDFFESINGYPIFGQSPKTGIMTVIIDGAGNLIKLETRLVYFDHSRKASYPLKTIEEAKKEVVISGVVVETEIQGVDPLIGEVLNIKTINLTSINYAYLKNIQEEYIIPIFVFDGELELSDGRSGKATLYLPAIKNQYLETK